MPLNCFNINVEGEDAGQNESKEAEAMASVDMIDSPWELQIAPCVKPQYARPSIDQLPQDNSPMLEPTAQPVKEPAAAVQNDQQVFWDMICDSEESSDDEYSFCN